jgi:UDP-N-acetylglucosamine 1-carboxyvinyltransferase
MEKFVIDGGVPLRGTVTPAGNKNAALPILAASVLTTDEVLVRNVPAHPRRRGDAAACCAASGPRPSGSDDNEVVICAAGVDREAQVDREHAERIRASFLLAGPLLARFGHADMPPPGGDVIGRRRLDPHLDAFRALGATFEHGRDIVLVAPSGGLRAGEVFMDEPSVMATENALMAAALTPGRPSSATPPCEPHVQDLARMLVKMGADIRGIGSNVLVVSGKHELGGCTHDVGPRPHRDRLLHRPGRRHRRRARGQGHRARGPAHDPPRLRPPGLQTELDGADVIVPGDQQLMAQRDVGEYKAKVQDGPWPAFPPTSPRSPSPSRPSAAARCSSTSGCSRTA